MILKLRDDYKAKQGAQYSPQGLNLARVLHRTDRLLQSPLRHAFPGLLAACSGEIVLFDAPASCADRCA